MKSEVSLNRNIKVNPEQTHKWFRLRKNKHLMHLSCFKWNWSLNFCRAASRVDRRALKFSLSVHFSFSSFLSHIVACRLRKKSVTVCRMVACDTFFVIVNVTQSILIGRTRTNGRWAGKLKRENVKSSENARSVIERRKKRKFQFESGKIIFLLPLDGEKWWKIWIVTRFITEIAGKSHWESF